MYIQMCNSAISCETWEWAVSTRIVPAARVVPRSQFVNFSLFFFFLLSIGQHTKVKTALRSRAGVNVGEFNGQL